MSQVRAFHASQNYVYCIAGDEAHREKDYDGQEEFIRRFLLHVLPEGFMRIRFYGFLAHNQKVEKLNVIRQALAVAGDYQKPPKKTALELISALLGDDWNRCPVCEKGIMRRSRKIPAFHALAEPQGTESRPKKERFFLKAWRL